MPQTRDGFYPSVLQRYQRSEGGLISALAECYVQGVSTRKVAQICEELFGEGLSHETVSRYAAELDKELAPWRARPLEEAFAYVILDARYEKARADHRIVDVAVQVAIGVSESGHRHVLGVAVAMGETTATGSEFLGSLLERGLHGARLVVSDAHPGLAEARRRHLPGSRERASARERAGQGVARGLGDRAALPEHGAAVRAGAGRARGGVRGPAGAGHRWRRAWPPAPSALRPSSSPGWAEEWRSHDRGAQVHSTEET